MTPLRLNNNGRELFALDLPPQQRRAVAQAVLLCNPLGHEAIRAQRLYRVLGDRLAASGVHVMRFDYFGSGDSAGDDSAFDLHGAVDDTRAVARALLQRSGAARLCLLGLRLGAEIAQLAAGALPVGRLILLEPLADGAAYLQQLEHAHDAELAAAFGPSWSGSAELRAFNRPPGSIDLLGCAITAPCREQIVAAYRQPPHGAGAQVLVATRDDAVRARWAAVPGVQFSDAASGVDWTTSDSLNATLVPPMWLEVILRTFANG